VRLADGRVLMAGNIYSINGTTARGLFQLKADGTVDTAYLAALPFTLSVYIRDIVPLPDGKLLVLGTLPLTNGTSAYLVRLTAAGALDATLLTSTNVSSEPQAMAVQADGRIVVTGNFTTILGANRSGIARLNTNGTLDAAYASGGAVFSFVRSMTLDAAGRVLAFGNFTSVGGQPVSSYGIRLTTDGALDPTFAPALTRAPDGIHRTADGRLIVYGYNDVARIGGAPTMIAEILSDGSINPAFFQAQRTSSLIEDEHGRLYALIESGLARLLPGGGIDRVVPTNASFLGGSGSGLLAIGSVNSMTLNNVTVPGITYFNPGPVDTVMSVAVSPPALTSANEGASVVYRGDFRGAQGATLQWLKNDSPIPGATTRALFLAGVTPADAGTYTLRATRDGVSVTTGQAVLQVVAQTGRAGEVDLTWGAGLQITNVTGAVSDAQGRVYLRGSSMQVNGAALRSVVGLDAQGAVRTDFTVSSRLAGSTSSMLLLNDGRLLVSGSDLRLDGNPVSLVRLTATGDIDPTFTVGLARYNGSVTAIGGLHRLADGRLLVLGGFNTFNTQTTGNAVRLSEDGVVDTSFSGNFGGGRFFAPAPGGKWWVAGGYVGNNQTGSSPRYFLRLNADGTLDETYRTIPRYSSFPETAAASGDEGFIISTRYGSGTTYFNQLRRLLPDGQFDANFASPEFLAGTSGNVYLSSIQTDAQGRIIVLGNFTRVNGVARNGIARLLADGQLDPSFVPPSGGNGGSLLLLPDANRIVVLGSGVQLGGINDRSGAVALRTPELPDNAPPALAGDALSLLVPPFRPLALGLSAYAPATATVQWYRDGQALPGATALTYRRDKATVADAGIYHAIVTTAGGSVTLPAVQVSVPSTDYVGGLGLRNAAVDVVGMIRRAVRQPDGRILVLSDGAFVDRRGPFQLFRLNADGTFHSGLTATVIDNPTDQSSSFSDQINAMVVDAEGRIYLGGGFTSIAGVTRTRVARLLADGTVDPSWNAAGTGPNNAVQALALEADGRLLIGGSFTNIGGTARPYLARLTTTGTLDPSFVPIGSGLNSVVNALLVQPSGHVVVGGSFSAYSGITALRLARFDATGALDATFVGSANNTVHALAALSDGRIAVSGAFSQLNSTSRGSPAVISADGVLDGANLGFFSSSSATQLGVGEGDAIYLVSGTSVARFPAAATADNLFLNAGQAAQRGAFNVQPQSLIPVGNEILYAGPFLTVGTVPTFGLTWLRATGGDGGPVITNPPVGAALLEGRSATFTVTAISPAGALSYVWTKVGSSTVLSTTASLAFASASLADAGTYRVVVSNGAGLQEAFASLTVSPDPDSGPGKVRISFAPALNLGSPQTLRLAPDGSLRILTSGPASLARLDPVTGATLASIPLTPTGGSVTGFVYDSTGRIYVWGQFSALNGHATISVARFTPEGQLDASFVSPLPEVVPLYSVVPLADGRVYVTGAFTVTLSGGGTRTKAIRLGADGSIDPAFDAGASDAKNLLVLPDGRLIGSNENAFFRLLPDGQPDATFAQNSISGLHTVHRLENGDLLVGHTGSLVNGLNRPGIVRFSADGVIDPAFQLDLGSLGFISRFAVRPDGRIVVGGVRYQNSNSYHAVAQFLPDGRSDPDFDLGRTYFSVQSNGNTFLGSLNNLLLLPDGDILVAGGFNRIDTDISRTNLVRLQGSPLPPTIVIPPSAATLAGGSEARLAVTVTGTPVFTYVWRHDGEVVEGATGAELVFNPVTVAAAGDYTVTITNAVGSVTTIPVTLTVTQEAQVITFAALPDVVLPSGPLTLDATSDSGLTVTLALVEGPASLDGNILTLTGPGTVTIRATQAGNVAYLPAIAVERTFVVSEAMTGFEAWQETHFTVGERADPVISGPNAIYGQDGLPNLVKYALGLNPKVNATSGLPEISVSSTHWVYTYTRPVARADLSYQVELSTNLTTWSTGGVVHELVNTEGDTQTWRASYPLASAANAYFRLRVQQVE
jgi:uncharacterized delta-60 repeat protein